MANRERIKKKRQQEKRKTSLAVGGVAIVITAIIGVIIFRDVRPGIGTEIPVERADHVPDGDPVESPSEPPTSGSHYGDPMPAGFYTEDSPEYLEGNHDGYLIHSLEHGYVVFWYNCDLLDAQGCQDLLANIQSTMDEYNGFKLIAFPRPSISVPLVMTSWGYLQEFETYDAKLAERFIEVNPTMAPEPNAP